MIRFSLQVFPEGPSRTVPGGASARWRHAQGEQGGVVADPAVVGGDQSSGDVLGGGGSVQAVTGGQGAGQRGLVQHRPPRAGAARVLGAFRGAGGVEQEQVAGGQPEPDVGQLDRVPPAEQGAEGAQLLDPAVGPADQGRPGPRPAQAARPAGGGGAEGGLGGGEEPR